jgi:hypothetical protein
MDMKAIEFDEVNVRLAEDQPEYETLPVCRQEDGQVTALFELDEDELAMLAKSKRIWFTQMTFNRGFHPVKLDVDVPVPEQGEIQTWSFSSNEEYFEGRYSGPLEAALEAFSQDEDLQAVWVGRNVVPPRLVDEDLVIERVAERTTEESGEWAEGYLLNVPKAVREDLKRELQAAWDRWEARHGMAPAWWNVEDVRVFHRVDDVVDGAMKAYEAEKGRTEV